jgi:hypothetical protein
MLVGLFHSVNFYPIVFCHTTNNENVVLQKSTSFLNVAVLVIILIALTLPNRIDGFSVATLLVFPVELIALALLLLPGRLGVVARWVLATLLALGMIFKCADMATFNVFARPFNPVFDFYLFANGMNLLKGAIGQLGALLIALLLIAVFLAIVVGAVWLLGRVQQLLNSIKKLSAGVIVIGAVFGFGALAGLWSLHKTSLSFYQQLAFHTRDVITTAADIQQFRAVLNRADELAPENITADSQPLFSRLKDKDVLVIFVESYGRTMLDKPEFSAHFLPVLERNTKALAERGFAVRSGFLTSPTVGGLSWLAHGTAMSGLWVDNQIRYNSLMISARPTLNRLFKGAGWRTLAVMPAITMAWPEGRYYGYDKIYAAHNLGYQGKPFNWVTMPDQYTLSAFEHYERSTSLASYPIAEQTRTPVMAEIALISSHAPWTPIPQMIDWNAVGDGSIFNAQATSGDSPEVVGKDNARIREQFRLSIEYALENIASYVMQYGDDNLVVLVLGDHQPAPLVTGIADRSLAGSRDVPVHLIARDPKIMEAVAHWQWTPGLVPAATAPVWPMNELRNNFIQAFSGAN